LRRMSGLVGLAVVLGALISLCMPLALGVVARNGTPIACGTGLHPDQSVARHEDSLNHQEHHLVSTQYILSNYIGECGQLISERRRLAAGVGGLGTVLIAAGVLGVVRMSRRSVSVYATP
jgi:hypothetical protein